MKNLIIAILFLLPVTLSAQLLRSYGVVEIGSTFPTSTVTGAKFAYRTVDSSYYRWVSGNTWVKIIEPSIIPDTIYFKQLSGTAAIVNGDTIDISTYLLHSDTASMLDPYIKLAGYGLSKLVGHTLQVDTSVISTKTYTNRFLLKSDTASMLLNYPSTAGYGIIDAGKTWKADTTSPNGLATRLFAKTLPTSIVTRRIAVSDGSNLVGYNNLQFSNSNNRAFIGGTDIGNVSAGLSVYGTTSANAYGFQAGQSSTRNITFGWVANSTDNNAYAYVESFGGSNPLYLQRQATGNVGIGINPNAGETAASRLSIKGGLSLWSTSSAAAPTGGAYIQGTTLIGTSTDVLQSILTVRSTTKASSPFPLQTTAEADAITGVRANFQWDLGVDGLRWYNSLRKAYALESTFPRGTSTRIPFFDANGQVTESANWTFASSTATMAMGTSSNTIAIGTPSFPISYGTSTQCVLIGGGVTTSNFTNATGIGMVAQILASGAVAIGRDSRSYGVAIGSGSRSNTSSSVVIGNSSSGNGVLIGYLSTQTGGGNSAMIGSFLNDLGYTNGIMMGGSITLSGNYGMAFGTNVDAGAGELVMGHYNSPITNVYYGNGRIPGAGTNVAGANVTINGSGAKGTDQAGGSLTLAAGKPTGAGTAPDLIFSTSTAGSTGTTLQSLTQRWFIKGGTGYFSNSSTANYLFDLTSSTNALGLPRGTVGNQPAIVSNTTPLRFFTDSSAVAYGDGGVYNFLATRAYARSLVSSLPTTNIYTANGTFTTSTIRTATIPASSLLIFNNSYGNLLRMDSSGVYNLGRSGASDNLVFGKGSMNKAAAPTGTSVYGNAALPKATSGFNGNAHGVGVFGAATYIESSNAFGAYAGASITNPTAIDLFGDLAGALITSGSFHAGFGYKAFGSATGGSSTLTGFGARVLFDLTTGTNNNNFGFDSGRGLTTGSGNTGVGTFTYTRNYEANSTILANGIGTVHLYIDSLGRANIGSGQTRLNAKLGVRGVGTSTAVTMLLEDSGGADILTVTDNKTIQAHGYGTGTKEAADLSKTQSNYIAGFATDGTVLDLGIGSGLKKSGGTLDIKHKSLIDSLPLASVTIDAAGNDLAIDNLGNLDFISNGGTGTIHLDDDNFNVEAGTEITLINQQGAGLALNSAADVYAANTEGVIGFKTSGEQWLWYYTNDDADADTAMVLTTTGNLAYLTLKDYGNGNINSTLVSEYTGKYIPAFTPTGKVLEYRLARDTFIEDLTLFSVGTMMYSCQELTIISSMTSSAASHMEIRLPDAAEEYRGKKIIVYSKKKDAGAFVPQIKMVGGVSRLYFTTNPAIGGTDPSDQSILSIDDSTWSDHGTSFEFTCLKIDATNYRWVLKQR